MSSTPSTVASGTSGTASTSQVASTLTTPSTTASEKKLSKSSYLGEYDYDVEQQFDLDDFENWESLSGEGVRMLEVKGLQTALLEGV